MSLRFLAGLTGLATLTLSAAPAVAQATVDAEEDADWWEIGAGAFVQPRYPGARAVRVTPRPTFSSGSRTPSRISGGVREGLRYDLIESPTFGFGPSARIDFGRRRSDADRYTPGLGKVGIALELGGFGEVALTRSISARIDARQGIGGHEGFLADGTLTAKTQLGPRTTLTFGPRARFTDGNYNRAYFGVTAAQSLASGGRFAPYTPGSGVSEVGGGATLLFPISRSWNGSLFGDYGRLVGPAGRSPVTLDRDGSRDQFYYGATVSYRFARPRWSR